MSLVKKSLPIGGLIITMVSASANAAFVLMLDDPNDSNSPLYIYDGDGNDEIGTLGVIAYSGAVGSTLVTVTTGVSKPVSGPSLLELQNLTVAGQAGSLLVSLTDTDYLGPVSNLTASYGGVADGTIDLSFGYDENNSEFGGAAFATTTGLTGDFSDSAAYAITPGSALFSITMQFEVTHQGNGQISGLNASIAPVPVPAAMWLFATGLIGLMGLRGRSPKAR